MDPLVFYKCLADETRLKCLLLIEREGELCVCELVEALQKIQPKISRHLAQLRKCGLLTDRRQGQWVFYDVAETMPEWAKIVLRQSEKANPQFLKQNISNLHQMGDRPARVEACC
ncbi:MAG: metalloregulator ArsR/SmtB family transcription factor [Sneathiella sp.]